MIEGKGVLQSFFGKRYYLPLISAILLSVSIVPLYFLVTNFIFLIPLLFFIKFTRNWGDAIRGSLWFAIPLNVMVLYWMYALIALSFFAVFLQLAMVICFSLFNIALVLLVYFFSRRSAVAWIFLVPFLWIVTEDLATYGPFKSTGTHIAYSMSIYPQLIQFLDITGTHGITFWLVLVNLLIFGAIISFRRKAMMSLYAAAALIVLLVPALYSVHVWRTVKFDQDLKISMVQPNIPLKKKLDRAFIAESMVVIQTITKEAMKQRPDLVILPESAFPYPVQHWIDKAKMPMLPEISGLTMFAATPILIGAEYLRIKSKEDYNDFNAALLMDGRGNVTDYYAKIYPVPFTEEIPFARFFGIQRLAKKGFLSHFGGFTPGDRFTVFEFEKKKTARASPGSEPLEDRKVRFSVLICYEGLFPELSREFRRKGAEFLVCITNDAWFGNTHFPFWHASALRMRAIENRLSIARCANTGITSFYDPVGRMYQSTEIFTTSIDSGFISLSRTQTPYDRYGDVIVYISYPIVILLFFICLFAIKKKQEGEPSIPT